MICLNFFKFILKNSDRFHGLFSGLTDGSVKQQVHTDDEYGHINYTGIVYLNPSIPEDCGTIISSKQFPSKFNKLIFFDGKHPHTMAKSFWDKQIKFKIGNDSLFAI